MLIDMLSPHLWFFVVKQRTNAKNGRTKVADWQDVGVEKFTRLSLSNWDSTARFSSHVQDKFVRTDFCAQGCYSSIEAMHCVPR